MEPEKLWELRDEYAGFCTFCQDITKDSGVEPDAEEILCERCNTRSVMGIEQALLLGYL